MQTDSLYVDCCNEEHSIIGCRLDCTSQPPATAFMPTLLPMTVIAYAVLLSLQGSSRLDTPAQHAQPPLAEPSFDSLYCQESTLTLNSADEEPNSTQPDNLSLSRQPTEHEIQYMDELDLTDNLGSLLGPGDSWIVPESAHFAMQAGDVKQLGNDNGMSSAAKMLSAKPFQELFPVSA